MALWQRLPSVARTSRVFFCPGLACSLWFSFTSILPPVCSRFLPFKFTWQKKPCFSASTYFFPDRTKKTLKDVPKPSLIQSWPGGRPSQGSRGVAAFPDSSRCPRPHFLGWSPGSRPKARTDRTVHNKRTGERCARGRGSPGLAGASLGRGSLRHVGPALRLPGRGVLQAPGSRRGAEFPRL